MIRRGFSLIEVLAVLAILVVVTAVSLPAVEGRLGRARFEAAVSRVDAGMNWVRAESQRRGEPLKLVAHEGRQGWLLVIEVLRASEAPRDEGARKSPEVVVELEQGLMLSDKAPGAAEETTGDAAEKPATGSGLVIAIFLPDGSAMASGPVFLSDAEKTVSLAVNQWTGGVKVSEVEQVVDGPVKNQHPAEPEEKE